MIDHLPFRLLAAAAVDETLAPADAAELDRHLVSCAACRRELVGMRHDHQALAELSPVPTAAWVRESLLEAARGRRGAGQWMLLAAAVLLMALAIGAGLVAGALLQEYRSLIPVEPVELSSTWTPVAVAAPEDGSRIRTVVSSDDGFVAGGASGAGATIWVSPDGLRWDEQSDLPAGDGAEVAAMVIVDGRIVAGGRAPDGAVIWTSGSAGSWQRYILPGGAGGGVNAITATGDGWIAARGPRLSRCRTGLRTPRDRRPRRPRPRLWLAQR
jgi:anti-sigma factor RsiW